MTQLIVNELKKSFRNISAVNQVSFTVAKGEIFGLIGPDGAGKTTIMRIIVTLLLQDSGTVVYQGKDNRQDVFYIRNNIGYMPQRFSLYPDLTVAENLNFFADLFNVPADEQKQRIEKLYEFSKLAPFAERRAGALSGGMKQKLALACVLIHQPPLLVLDEPTVGVDPVSRAEFWKILHELAANGTAILISTSYMDEATQCDKVALMHEGKLLAAAPPRGLLNDWQSITNKILTFEDIFLELLKKGEHSE